MARKYSDRDLKLLWGQAAARCAFPNCQHPLVAEKTNTDRAEIIGEIAHIVAHEDNGPRGDKHFPKSKRDRYENLILLCPTHHTLVDKQANSFTISDLQAWKIQHEAWVIANLASEIGGIDFQELEALTLSLVSAPSLPSTDFKPLAPAEKLAHNGLSRNTHKLLLIGLSQAPQVRKFISMMESNDSQWPERLKAGFVEKYRSLTDQGVTKDALFEGLSLFAKGKHNEMKYWAAGLAVIAYLFETCEVFEK